jgi:hypothetical protein
VLGRAGAEAVAAAGVFDPQLIHEGVEKFIELRQPGPVVESPRIVNSTKRENFLRILLASLLARRELPNPLYSPYRHVSPPPVEDLRADRQ